MTQANLTTSRPIFTNALRKRMLIGTIIASIMIVPFVIAAGKGQPAWGSFWQVKPLLLTPALGALVGLCFDIAQPLRNMDGWMGKMFFILSVIGFGIGLWMSMILGLAGTMWD